MATERDLRVSLRDMLDAAQKALSFSAGMTYEAFAFDAKTVFATIRALEVVGETAKNIPHASPGEDAGPAHLRDIHKALPGAIHPCRRQARALRGA